MGFVVDPPEIISLPVKGGGSFPVNNIYCVGRNYAAHAVEMGSDPNQEPPFFFMKPRYAVLNSGNEMEYPPESSQIHHELELIVALSSGGRDIAVEKAMDLVFGYGVGIDMTRRDLQSTAKDRSWPWEAGKVFKHAAPCSEIVPITQIGELNEASITLSVNGEIKQKGNVNQMIWKVPQIISRLSKLFGLYPGDLLFTGTPEGVGPVKVGDRIAANLESVAMLEVCVVSI